VKKQANKQKQTKKQKQKKNLTVGFKKELKSDVPLSLLTL